MKGDDHLNKEDGPDQDILLRILHDICTFDAQAARDDAVNDIWEQMFLPVWERDIYMLVECVMLLVEDGKLCDLSRYTAKPRAACVKAYEELAEVGILELADKLGDWRNELLKRIPEDKRMLEWAKRNPVLWHYLTGKKPQLTKE